MTNTHIFTMEQLEPIERAGAGTVLRRAAMSFLLFSGALFVLLLASYFFLLPRLSRVEVGGTVRGVTDMRLHQTALRAQILTAEDERRQHILAIHDPSYLALKALRGERLTVDDLRARVADAALATTHQPDAIHLSGVTIDHEAKTATIEGDIRFVGTRSMTVLAEFTEALRADSLFTSVSTPAFTRIDSTDGPHSPFTITLTLP